MSVSQKGGMIKEAVILAAGQGTRIRNLSGERPKPLVEVAGKTLLDSAVENLLSNGIERVVVVVGYEHQQIRDHVAAAPYRNSVVFVQNDEWMKENGISVFKAREALEDDFFLLQMVDHIFDRAIYREVINFDREQGHSYLCIDRDIQAVFDLPDATKLVVEENGSISSISKDLNDFNACDTGLFLMSSDIFKYFEQAGIQGRSTISNAVQDAGRANSFFTIDVTGIPWLDVDTYEAWEEAERRGALEG